MAPENESRKRKRGWEQNRRLQHGSKGKRKDLGRGEWSRQHRDRREQIGEANAKRQKLNEDGESITQDGKPSALPAPFAEEEIAAEERRPKRKVAVLIGYSGSGYKGMQINTVERTIEGELFNAFVAAGAISKANANDPKKSALVRCARTDKGVHAAGNVISLKLITEDEDIVSKINSNLSEQIRVWGILRTVNSFNCYQACDSRWYEYLIPTHTFLPPHPDSYLGKKLPEWADEAHDREAYNERQFEVSTFWADTEENTIRPILDELEEPIRSLVQEALYKAGTDEPDQAPSETKPNNAANKDNNTTAQRPDSGATSASDANPVEINTTTSPKLDIEQKKTLDATEKRLRQAYMSAKRLFRIDSRRIARVQSALNAFLGTQNFHNYTIQKAFKDPSAKRLIKSFKVNPTPILINGTEWLSIKIHGQSFMMHQIRKMVSMIALVVRCGCHIGRIQDTFDDVNVVIPKAPGLGLLLERPVFDTYNKGAAEKFEREKIDFDKHEGEMDEFKQREIYERIFREEEAENAFQTFFAHVDNFKEPQFVYLSSKGMDAIKQHQKEKGVGKEVDPKLEVDSDEDEEPVKGEGEG